MRILNPESRKESKKSNNEIFTRIIIYLLSLKYAYKNEYK